MNTIKKISIAGLLFVTIALPLFYTFGRSLWYPIYVKIQGGQSVAEVVEKLKNRKGLFFDPSPFDKIVLLGLKSEQILEAMGVTQDGDIVFIDSYPFTGFSGSLGPKLREGDGQIPEGIYSIEYLNPNSSFHLSMKLDYPNEFDRKMGQLDGRKNLGSDIFIHGKSSTIGCIPIGDDAIERLFLIVSEMGIEKIEVIICPYDMREDSKHLEVDSIEWEAELYSLIRKAMEPLKPQPVGRLNSESLRSSP